MENIGETFTELRKSKGLTIGAVAKGICSPSLVWGFENDRREIGYKKLYQLIAKISISLNELRHAANKYILDDFGALMQEVSKRYIIGDVEGLKKLLLKEQKENKNKPFTHNLTCLMIKFMLSNIDTETEFSDSEKEQIASYLFKAERWSYYELTLFGNTINIFTHATLTQLSNEVISRTRYYHALPENKKLVTEVLLNVMACFIQMEDFENAIRLKKEIEQLLEERHLLRKTIFLFMKGALDFSMGEQESGAEKMLAAISVFETLESMELAAFYRGMYESFM